MNEQLALLPTYLTAHLALSLAALALGVFISVPLGVLVHRHPRLEAPVLGLASVLQTIPGLALLAIMVPALAAIGASSIGYLPALLGLFLYSLLPILRNTVTGLSSVDPALLEAARGVGMTDRESLLQVELPIALPVIAAGVRTSAVWTVGTATLSTPVGAPSLGNYIFGGLQTRNYSAVLLGCVASAVLALLVDVTIRTIGEGIERRSRVRLQIGLALVTLLCIAALRPVISAMKSPGRASVTIGAKTFTESYTLAHVLAQTVSRDTGLPTRMMESLGSTVVFDALVAGQIDVYVDYSGTLWSAVLGHSEPRPARSELLSQVRTELSQKYGVLVVASLGFENTYALAMRRVDANRLGIHRLSDLAPHANRLRIGADYELFQRSEWRSIIRNYGLSFAEQRSMDPSLLYEAAKSGQVDIIGAFSTDGRIAAYDLVVLDDDRGAIPPYDAVILAGARAQRELKSVIQSLHGLEGRIDANTMRKLNQKVDEDHLTPEAAAKTFTAPAPP
jgi:osmoprotectant transport system permease protein